MPIQSKQLADLHGGLIFLNSLNLAEKKPLTFSASGNTSGSSFIGAATARLRKLGPNLLAVIWTHIATCYCAISRRLDLGTACNGNLATSRRPLVNLLRGNSEGGCYG